MHQDQPNRVGRRLAAIVAADVAGYSRLMGLDEVGAAHALREHRKATDALVEKHGGRLVKSTGGRCVAWVSLSREPQSADERTLGNHVPFDLLPLRLHRNFWRLAQSRMMTHSGHRSAIAVAII
jgi:class 3 adenylate cyclase